MGIGSLMSTAVINKIGTKGCLIVGGLGNVVWIMSMLLVAEKQGSDIFFLPDFYIVVVLFCAAIINGITVGILWASANQYIAECAPDDNKGFYFSYFWSFYMAS